MAISGSILWDDNGITDDGATHLSISEDVAARFRVAGWHVVEVDGHDIEAVSAAITAAKADPREELDRLRAHHQAAAALLDGKGPVGRQLDFLCQELNREANTLCAKSADIELTRVGLDLKATVEQVREQVQNIE